MMKKIFTKGFIAVALVSVVGFVSSCKDYNDEIVAEYRGGDETLKGEIADLRQGLADAEAERDSLERSLNAQIEQIKKYYATKAELEDAKNNHDADIADLNTKIAAVDANLQATKAKLETTVGKLTQAEQNIVALQDAVATLKTEDAKIKRAIEELKKSFNDGQITQDKKLALIEDVLIPAINGEIATLKEQKDSLANVAKSHKIAIANVNELIEDLAFKHAKDCDSLANVLSDVQDEMKELASKADVKDLVDNLEARLTNAFNAEIAGVEGLMLDLYNDLKDAIENNTGAIIRLNSAIVDLEEEMRDSITVLREDLDTLETRVKASEDAIEKLVDRVDKIENALEARISSILVQGAYSPVIGYFNMPLGVRSNILAAYKGEVIEDMSFPFGFIDGKINSLIPLQSSLGYKGEIVSELGDGEAGKLYLTINPAEVNLDSVEFALVNSQNKLAPVKLDSVVVSSDVLKFGYTRAGAPLYEASATITDVAKASLDLNLSDYKDILSDLKGGNINLTDIAGTLYSSINEIADANAVRASWTDSLGAHTVYSDFAVAAVAVKPLSYNFLADLDVQNIPGVNRISKVIDNVIDRINVDIHIGNFKDVEFNVDHLDLDENKFVISIDTTLKVDGQDVTLYKKGEISGFFVEVKGEEYPLQVKEDVIVSIKEKMVTFTYKNDNFVSEILKIEDLVNSELSEIEHLIDQVNDMLAELRETDQKLHQSVDDAKENVKSELNKYLDKLNGKLCAVINSANAMLQPVLLANNGKDFALLSQSKSRPVETAGEITLVPTSYTGEYLAPACKKYVAITAVNGSTDNLAAINAAAGERLNKVLDGDVRAISFKGESGNTYEITYSALDYAGMVVNTKYYITVK